MSIIAFKIFEDKIQVAADGRVMSDDEIITDNGVKIHKLSESLIIGQTGLHDTNPIYKKFVEVNQRVFEELDNTTDGLALMKRFREYLENYGYKEEALKNGLGGFLIANKKIVCMFRFDTYLSPFTSVCSEDGNTIGATGSTKIYTSALIDVGYSLEDAIKISAKKYTSINDNVTILEIKR